MGDWLSRTTGQMVLFGLVEVGVLVWLYRTRRRAAVVSAVVVPLFGAAIVLADLLHETPKEHVDRVLSQIRKALLEGNTSALLEHIDPEYDYGGLTYQRLRPLLRRRLSRWKISHLRITNKQYTTVAATRISVRLEVSARGRTREGVILGTESTWRLTFVPLGERWVLAEIEPVKINGRPFRRLLDLL